jgi:hypothetical protein
VTSAPGPSSGTQITATASCPAGKEALGGGVNTSVSNPAERHKYAVYASYPSGASQWTGSAVVTNGFQGTRTLTVTAYVLCGE